MVRVDVIDKNNNELCFVSSNKMKISNFLNVVLADIDEESIKSIRAYRSSNAGKDTSNEGENVTVDIVGYDDENNPAFSIACKCCGQSVDTYNIYKIPAIDHSDDCKLYRG